MQYGFIYETTNLINGMKYIGSHKRTQDPNDPDDSWYLGSGSILLRAIDKYGRENFHRIILKDCESKEDLVISENAYLHEVDAANNPDYYNLSNEFFGGDAKGENSRMWGRKASDTTRKKHRNRMLLNNPMKNKEVVEKRLKATKGKKRKSRSKESNLKSSISIKNWNDSEEGLKFRKSLSKEFSGEGNPFYGHKHDKSTLETIGATNRGTIYVHNDIHTKRIHPDLLESYMKEGYVLGRLPFNTKKGRD